MEPPSRWMWSTSSGVRTRGVRGLEGEALEAVADAEDFADAVVVVEFEEGGADDVVEAGAEAAAGDDGRAGLAGIEEDLLAGAGALEEGVGIGGGIRWGFRLDGGRGSGRR
jgi:hypothetical protein